MAKARVRVRTKKNPAFTNLQKQLKAAGRGDLRKDLRKAIQREGAPVVSALRAATMGVQVRVTSIEDYGNQRTWKGSRPGARPRSTNLRSRTANAIGTQVLVSGIRFKVNGKRIDPRYGDNLARYLIGGKRRWRHPIFGGFHDSPATVMQEGQDVWFDTLRPRLKGFRRAVQGVIDDTLKQLS